MSMIKNSLLESFRYELVISNEGIFNMDSQGHFRDILIFQKIIRKFTAFF